MVQSTRPGRKQRIEAAIGFALNRQWERAAEANRALLAELPNDLEAANRLGKALTELEDFSGAIEAYEQALTIDPANAIARKNLTRLQELQQAADAKPRRGARAKPAASKREAAAATPPGFRINALIEESGRSAELELQRVIPAALPGVDPGDPATLTITPSGVAVENERGELLGHIEPRAGLRLKRLIEGGNQYAVVIRHVDGEQVTVYIRETYRHPTLSDQASFLTPASSRRRETPRAYTRASVLRYDGDEEDEDYDLDEDSDGDDDWPAPGTSSSRDDDEDDTDVGDTSDSASGTDDTEDDDDEGTDDSDSDIELDDPNLGVFDEDLEDEDDDGNGTDEEDLDATGEDED